MLKLFPTEFVRLSIAEYIKDHGVQPKILAACSSDVLEWAMTATLPAAKKFDLEVIVADYLKPGEYDLAMGIKQEESSPQESK